MTIKKEHILKVVAFLFISFVWAVLLVYAANMSGYIKVAKPLPPWLMHPFSLAYRHLQGSLIPFALSVTAYFYLINKIRRLLDDPETPLSALSYYDRLMNLTISIFFGIGVIWTAIGMESALVNALSGLQSGDRQLGALDIMHRLVNGGMLIALSTTIVGGFLGYGGRLLKVWLIGPKWDEAVIKKMGEKERKKND